MIEYYKENMRRFVAFVLHKFLCERGLPMEKLTNPSVIMPLLKKHGFEFSKKLGQNFLINPTVCPRIAQMGISDSKTGILEIGAGIGVLTNELAKCAEKVVSFEIDGRLIPLLNETLAEHDNIKIIHGDVMKADLRTLIDEEFGDMPVSVCANLPYYITSPILMLLLESRLPFEKITVLVQREAAKRLCAEMGSRECGAVSAAVNYFGTPEYLFDVSRGSFLPPPNVDSAVISITTGKRHPLDPCDEKNFFSLVKAAFSQRRKTLPNSISSKLPFSSRAVAEALEKCGKKPTARAEELSLEELIALSTTLFANNEE